MKILQIVTQMEGGGAQRAAILLHDALRQRGYEAELWFLYLKRPTYLAKAGVRALWNQKPAGFDYLRVAANLFSRVRAWKPDVIITHTHYANILGHCASVLAGIKHRVAVHHSPLEKCPTIARHADWLFGALGIYTAQVAVSDAVVKSMATYPKSYRDSVRRIHNGIAVDRERKEGEDRYLTGLPLERPKILHVGRLAKEKNHSALIQALHLLPDAYLICAGDGELRETIASQVRASGLTERVRFLGEIGPDEIRTVMQACDVFMFPSFYEAMPMALLEAMSVGMPIVASDIPANRELLHDAGILVPPAPSKLADAAAQLLADRPRAAELGRKAAERAKQFTVDVMADGYVSLLCS